MDSIWELISTLCDALSQFCPVQFFPSAGLGSQVLDIQGQQYRVLKQIGEGGYAFVYLAKPLSGGQLGAGAAAQPVAIKKILAGSAEQLASAKSEVSVLQALSHVNCLPLLAHSITQSSSAAAGRAYEVLLVFPAYQDGTLLNELDRLAVEGSRLSSRQVLEIFRQICAGVSHMHSRGYAHMDLKPHNVLIKSPATAQQHQQQQRQLTAAANPASLPRPGSRPRIRATVLPDSDEEVDLEAGASLVSRGHQAVIMDFGSARRMPLTVSSRQQALTVQEDAEAHCTATFRAPELFDVPSHCTLTTAVDVWALGCTLYSMMYGASPFQQALDQGASLALAVMNCRIPWPASTAPHAYPDALHKLVTLCLEVDPTRRPSVPQVLQRVDDLLAQQL